MAWERVCQVKSEGGLEVRDLATQNKSLLLKMLHHLHVSPRSRWAAWIWDGADGHSLLARGELTLGEHQCSLEKLLPLYRALTTVEVGDGRSCSF